MVQCSILATSRPAKKIEIIAMEPESPKTRLNQALRVQSWRTRNDYKAVAVLIIYWQDSDDVGFENEARSLGNLFADDFHYEVEYFMIPSLAPYLSLDNKISSFLTKHGQRDCLAIIHYGGHGDPDDEDDCEKLAVWAAYVSSIILKLPMADEENWIVTQVETQRWTGP